MGLKQDLEALAGSRLNVAYREGLAADLADGAPFDIFTVDKGPVLVYAFLGVVTVVINGAAIPRIQFTPVVAGVQIPINAAAASINGDAVSTVYHWNGTLADALGPTTSLGFADTAETAWAGNQLLLPAGVLAITNAVATTGIIDWYVVYVPCMIGAAVLPL